MAFSGPQNWDVQNPYFLRINYDISAKPPPPQYQ
jgi:hypothetical protein